MILILQEGIGSSSLLCCFWLIAATSVLIVHISHLLFSRFGQSGFPMDLLNEFYLFGKLKKPFQTGQRLALFSVPKRWFTHFYGFGFIVHSFVMLGCLLYYANDSFFNLDELLQNYPIIHQLLFETKQDKRWLSALVVLLMEWFQISRRLYECLFTSSFSNSTINIMHYFFGVFFYSSFGVGLLLTVNLQSFSKDAIQHNEFSYCLLGFSVFAIASLSQHKSMVIFASLRRNIKDNPKLGHHIPRGHLFEWVSCPHYLCEIIIYGSMCLIFGMGNLFLNSVFSFVCVNQICSSLMVHDWYKKKFTSYPPYRRAIIPYLL